jgi:hypothetical protein
VVFLAISISLVFLGWLIGMGISRSALLASLLGGGLVSQVRTVDFGIVEQGTSVTARIPIKNISGVPITLLGGHASCGCTTLTELPLTLAPNSTCEIGVKIDTSRKSGTLREMVELYTDYARVHQFRFSVTGVVTIKATSPKPPRPG